MFALLFAFLVASQSALHFRAASGTGGEDAIERNLDEGGKIYQSGLATLNVKEMMTGLTKLLEAVKMLKKITTSEEKTRILKSATEDRMNAVNKLTKANRTKAEIKKIENLFDQIRNELKSNPFYKESWFWIIAVVVAGIAAGLVYFFVLKK